MLKPSKGQSKSTPDLAILPASTVVNEVERKQLVSYKLEGGIHNRPRSFTNKPEC